MKSGEVQAVADDEERLCSTIEEVVGRRLGKTVTVERLERTPASFATLAPADILALADVSTNPARICFIGWEMAGVGCGLLDLVHLKYGLDPASDLILSAAYFEELRGTNLIPRGDGELAASATRELAG